jgi:hypothetical protein
MKKSMLFLSVALLAFAAGLHAAKPGTPALPDTPYFKAITDAPQAAAGETYYLRSSVWFNGDSYRTSNYRGGTLHPINTKVTLVKTGKNEATLSVDGTSTTLLIKNETKYSRREMPEILKQMLSLTPIDMDGMSKATAENILAGKIAVGMTKEQVAMSRGIPPGNRNRTLTANTWGYYNSRRTYIRVYFADGLVTRISDQQSVPDSEAQ